MLDESGETVRVRGWWLGEEPGRRELYFDLLVRELAHRHPLPLAFDAVGPEELPTAKYGLRASFFAFDVRFWLWFGVG